MNALGSIVKYIGMMIVVVALTELTYLELFAGEYQSVNANVIEKQLYTQFGEKMNLTNSSGCHLKLPESYAPRRSHRTSSRPHK